MALFRRSLSLLRCVDRFQSLPTYSLFKKPRASFLHTIEFHPNKSNKNIFPAVFDKEQTSNQNSILSLCHNMNNLQILPSLPSRRNVVLDLPALPAMSNLEMPTSKAYLDNAHIMPEKVKMEDPRNIARIEKHAVRMIVIRRRKMKNHQRRKFFKKNWIVYTRLRQAKKNLKEKNLQLKLLALLNEGRKFSAEKYAFDLLSAAYEKVELPAPHKKKNPWEFN